MVRWPSQVRFLVFLCGFLWTGGLTLPRIVHAAGLGATNAPRTHSHHRHRWGVPTYSPDPTKGDVADFDDPIVRQSAVAALGHRNGSVVAVDPSSGRILSIVNQRLAFSAGFEPCSTIKPVIALAALEREVITRETMIRVASRRYLNLTEAMARSDNTFFEELGRRLGFETVSHYARLLGLGESAGYDLPGEMPGTLPSAPPRNGGVARMSSFGEGIRITPLQLAAMVSALANGGNLYYLQYSHAEQQAHNFEPRLKRQLDIAPLLPEIREGMLAAVLYGTARSSYDPDGEPALGKTGTCSDQGGRLGWYVSYADQMHPRLVLVVLLRGSSRGVNGPHAADIAGHIYHDLREHNFFAGDGKGVIAPRAAFSP